MFNIRNRKTVKENIPEKEIEVKEVYDDVEEYTSEEELQEEKEIKKERHSGNRAKVISDIIFMIILNSIQRLKKENMI